jgi:hypothetical protein
MYEQKKLKILSFAIMLTLLMAAVIPISALAQDEIGSPQTDTPVMEESVVEETSVTEILDQLPADTGLTVLDASGNALPLASTDAAEALAAADPYFMIGADTYRFFGATGACSAGGFVTNCFDNTPAPIQRAINYLSSNNLTPTDGNIYVDAGTYTEKVTVDAANWTTKPTYLGLIGAGSSLTTLNGTFKIWDMNAFTLSGFSVAVPTVGTAAGVSVYGNTGTLQLTDLVVANPNGSYGIDIGDQTGDVNLTNVTASGSGSVGANIYVKTGNVTINNGNFSSNKLGNGLDISADVGNVTLNNVTATHNGDFGASIWSGNGSIFIDGGDFSINEFGSGLSAGTDKGDITLNNVSANNNRDTGAKVLIGKGNIFINGGDFSANGYGLNGYTDEGNITLNQIAANNNNKGSGASIWIGLGSLIVNKGDFSVNQFGSGLIAGTDNGNVALNNVTSSNNGLSGAYASGNNIDIICGNYSNNGRFGLTLDNSGGHTFLDEPYLNGNGLGGYWLDGGTASFGGCGEVSSEKGGKRGFISQNNLFIQFEPEAPICTDEQKVVLESGDGFGVFQNLCGLNFQLKEVKIDVLQGTLPDASTYLTSMDAGVFSGGTVIVELPSGGKITLKFPVPAGANKSNLTVLFWNGAQWVKVAGGEVIDNFYVVKVTKPGTYVLTD